MAPLPWKARRCGGLVVAEGVPGVVEAVEVRKASSIPSDFVGIECIRAAFGASIAPGPGLRTARREIRPWKRRSPRLRCGSGEGRDPQTIEELATPAFGRVDSVERVDVQPANRRSRFRKRGRQAFEQAIGSVEAA